MFKRIQALPQQHHFFLFGARGTGKSTIIKLNYNDNNSLWIDLLDPGEERRFSVNPSRLEALVRGLSEHKKYVVIDEVQKVPKLLDVVHKLIESDSVTQQFVLTGSSARKLKRGGANLLAGRAFVSHLYPLSYLELGESFDLDTALHWGLLPKIYHYEQSTDRRQYLDSYANTYLKEEIWGEQFIQKLDPFRRFLEVAAQSNSKIINFSNIARDVGVADKTVKEYYALLEDTLLGFFLEPFHHSFRKRLHQKPKFYFFDTGVTRALARHLNLPLKKSTSAYGETFEHFIILECLKLADYHQLDYRFSYLKTQSDNEIDLIVDRPGQKHLFIEIKSTDDVSASHVKKLADLAADFGDCEAVCFSRDTLSKRFGEVQVYPWQEGIEEFFGPMLLE